VSAPGDPGSERGDAGFSILEVVVALVILLTVLVSVSSLMVTAFKVGANSRFRQAATEIATSTLDNQVQTGATALLGDVGDTALPSIISNGQTYLAEMEVNPYTPGSSGCVSPTGAAAEMLKVTVWVTWANETSGATWWVSGSSSSTGLLVEETTLVALPATDFDPTLGTIFVSILNASGSADQGVVVSATNGTNTLATTTTASGCALFANITPGNWWVTGSKSGYIDDADDWSTTTNSASPLAYGSQSSPVQVVADQTINVAWNYDQEAMISPSYSLTTANSWLPINISSLPLTFYTSPTNTGLAPNTYVSTSPAEAYPYPAVSPTPSYYVVAGSCGSESAPGSGTYTNATTDGQPVTLTPGSQASPVFALTPIKLAVLHGATVVSGATVSASVASTDSNCGTGSLAMPTLQLGQTCSGASACAVNAAFHKKRGRYPADAFLVATCSSNCATSTTVSSSVDPSTYGTPPTFTATVTCTTVSSPVCATPNAGTVTFKVGGTTESPVTVTSSGLATFTAPSTQAVGSTSVTATYNGSGKWKASAASSTLTQVVDAPTSTTLTANPNPNAYGTSTILTATVAATAGTSANPTGLVTFTNGGVALSGCGGVTLSSGVANCTVSGLSGGAYSMMATYTATGTFMGSISSTLTQNVSAASTSTALTSSSSLNTSTVGSSVTFTATVTAASGGPATGTVTFKAGGATIAACSTPVTLTSGAATCTTSALTAGAIAMTAVYTPTTSADFGTSTGAMTQYVYASSASIMSGLPYGVWIISVTDSNGTVAVAATLTITPSGVYLNGSSTATPTGTEIVLSD
jgi:Tfp pilus assembly protein PilV